MVKYSLRHASEEDFPSIRALIRDVRINPIGLYWRRFVIAVTPDGKIIGCGQVKSHLDGSRELASIAVRCSYRGQGVARSIIERLIIDNQHPLYLVCRSRLSPLYEKFGFQMIGLDDMPLYYRRISQLVGLTDRLARDGSKLYIMRLD